MRIEVGRYTDEEKLTRKRWVFLLLNDTDIRRTEFYIESRKTRRHGYKKDRVWFRCKSNYRNWPPGFHLVEYPGVPEDVLEQVKQTITDKLEIT